MFHSLSLLHLLYSYIIIHIKLNYRFVLCCLSILAAEGYHVLINVIPQDDESEPPPKAYTYKCIEDGVSFSDNNHFARELLVVTTVSLNRMLSVPSCSWSTAFLWPTVVVTRTESLRFR